MGSAPYGDVTILYHGLLAFFVPFGWTVILYPYWRLHRQQAYKTLIFVAVLSFSFMVAKEIYLDKVISSNDIAADLLGLFFGTGLSSLLFYLERKIARSWGKTEDRAAVPREKDREKPDRRESPGLPREISLRDILSVLVKIHGRGAALYDEASRDGTDRGAKALSIELAKEKRRHGGAVKSLLAGWPQKTPDVHLLDWMDERIGRSGIFSSPIRRDVTDRQLLDYAVEQEDKIHKLFSGLHNHFQGYSWRTIQYENIILELNGRGRQLQEHFREPEVDPKASKPAAASPPAKKSAAAGHEKINGRDAAILVVDDDEAIRTAVSEYLRDDGYVHVDAAADGEAALDRFENGTYDIVIVDIAMPGRHGIEVLRQIKSRHPETQVIIITGRASKDSAIAALRLGAFDYIEKPFDFAVLSKCVAEGLKKKRLSVKGA